MKKRKVPIIILLLLGLFALSSISSCATIFHPERQGNHGGHLDVGMLVLDILWFFAGFFPGIIALLVDFSTGAIYHGGGGGGGHDHYYRTPGGGPIDLSAAGTSRLDKIWMPAEGTVKYTLPVRGDGVHVIHFLLVSADGEVIAEDTNTFLAESSWKNIKSSLTVKAGDAKSGVLHVTIDGELKSELPVEFAAAAK
jgi:hypothetical protein